MSPPIRHALVTGGASGIGLAIARALVAGGCRVSILGRDLDRLNAAATALPAFAVQADVTDPDALSQALTQVTAASGPVDILVNNAGVVRTAPFLKQSADDWDLMWKTNVLGPVTLARGVLASMRERGWGRIVNIASTAALKPYAYTSAYVTSKHGLLGFTRALALEVATTGVTVNAICPGYADTEIIRAAVGQIAEKTGRAEAEALRTFTGANPQGRLVQPDEVAQAVAWLVQDASGSVTGQALVIAGGEVM